MCLNAYKYAWMMRLSFGIWDFSMFMGFDQMSKRYKLYNPNEGNMMISRYDKFDEEGAWDWKIDDGEKYYFLSVLDKGKERYEDHQEQTTPPQSPMVSSLPWSFFLFSFSNGSSSSGNPSSLPKRMGSLDELYEVTTPIDDDVTLYIHLATCDPIVFEEVIKVAK